MDDFLKHGTWYVKGFSRSFLGKVTKTPPKKVDIFFVWLTNRFVTKYLLVTSARKRNGVWVLTPSGSTKTITLKTDSDNARELLECRLVVNFKHDIMHGVTYDTVPLEEERFEQLSLEIDNGTAIYRLVGKIPDTGDEIVTSNLKKLWKDSEGRLHALTRSGTHYVL